MSAETRLSSPASSVDIRYQLYVIREFCPGVPPFLWTGG